MDIISYFSLDSDSDKSSASTTSLLKLLLKILYLMRNKATITWNINVKKIVWCSKCDRLVTELSILSFALLDYKVTNQIYLSVTQNRGNTKLRNQAMPFEAL